MNKSIDTVYVVKQTQESMGYYEKPIYVYSTEKLAQEKVDELNEEYENGSEHFYEYEAFTLDE